MKRNLIFLLFVMIMAIVPCIVNAQKIVERIISNDTAIVTIELKRDTIKENNGYSIDVYNKILKVDVSKAPNLYLSQFKTLLDSAGKWVKLNSKPDFRINKWKYSNFPWLKFSAPGTDYYYMYQINGNRIECKTESISYGVSNAFHIYFIWGLIIVICGNILRIIITKKPLIKMFYLVGPCWLVFTAVFLFILTYKDGITYSSIIALYLALVYFLPDVGFMRIDEEQKFKEILNFCYTISIPIAFQFLFINNSLYLWIPVITCPIVLLLYYKDRLRDEWWHLTGM